MEDSKVVGKVGPGGSKDPTEPLPDPEAPVQKAISVQELISKCGFAAGRLSNNNPHKMLFLNLGYALHQLMSRCKAYEREVEDLKAELEGRKKTQLVTLD